MSLDSAKAAYKTALKAAYTTTLTAGTNTDNGLDAFCDAVIAAQETWIKAATVNYLNGLFAGSVAVTGVINGGVQ